MNTTTTRAWLAIEQPSPDAGPFGDVWNRIGGVIFWGAGAALVVGIIVASVFLLIEKLDPTREAKAGPAILWGIGGAICAASAAGFINWAMGS